jgi:hypothetical protein
MACIIGVWSSQLFLSYMHGGNCLDGLYCSRVGDVYMACITHVYRSVYIACNIGVL